MSLYDETPAQPTDQPDPRLFNAYFQEGIFNLLKLGGNYASPSQIDEILDFVNHLKEKADY